MRVIITNTGNISPELRLFSQGFSPILIFSTSRMPEDRRAALEQVATLHLSNGPTVDLREMLSTLRSVYRVKSVVCEGGPSLFRSLLEASLIDELNLTVCPRIFGGKAAPTLTGIPGQFLPKSVHCKLAKMEIVGEECFLRYRVGL